MACWTICSLSLLAIFVIGGRAFKTTEEPTEEPTPCNAIYNYYAETHLGAYTGPWMADTLSCFDRVPAVIEHDLHKNEQRLVNFTVDEKPSDKALYKYSVEYARDNRTLKNHSLNTPNGRYYFLNANDCAENGTDYHDGTYPLNKEAIWQISIPKDHVAYVVLTNISLEQEQSGNCINDYISMYDDCNTPTKFCSSHEMVDMLYKREGAERLTIKFQSNEAINEGGFSGAVWLLHETNLRSRRDVSFAETVETVSVAEEEHINEDEIEQAIACLIDIVKHGEAAAAKYTEEAPNEECRKMAEAFFMQG